MSFLKHKAIILGILLFLCGVLLYACAETPQKRTLGGAAAGGKKFAAKNASIATRNLQRNIW